MAVAVGCARTRTTVAAHAIGERVVRVGFVIESTGNTISCLLNPVSLVVSRTAGIVPERTLSGAFARRAAADAPLIYTAGGRTELHLELLFDAPLNSAMRATPAGAPAQERDVRDMTAPFFALSENADDPAKLPIVRFVWGKAWNVRGIVAAVSERLEHFSQNGVPQRSWMTMRFLRVLEAAPSAAQAAPPALDLSDAGRDRAKDHVVAGAGNASDVGAQRLDTIAAQYYGDPSLWRAIARYNGIDNRANVPSGTTLRIPPTAGT
jgi:Contractile injection system tube protein